MSMSASPPDAGKGFNDLSGVSSSGYSNPYDALIEACNDDEAQIQSKYMSHRINRNAQQKSKFLDDDFTGVTIDTILLRLLDPTIGPGYVDPRHCLVLWARPTEKVKALIAHVQQELLKIAPSLWLMPQNCLHMTAMEVTHSKTAKEIEEIVKKYQEEARNITDYTFHHRTRLIKPFIGYDSSALALSFVPAAGENLAPGRDAEEDKFTYHHLRRDLFGLLRDAGIHVDSRYVVPSSHLTIGRFINTQDFTTSDGSHDRTKIQAFIGKIEEINQWLERNFWPQSSGEPIPDGGEFNVGEETGLLCRRGQLWYGGGDTVDQGKSY